MILFFQPTHYTRFMRKTPGKWSGWVAYQLSRDGLEDPNCLLVPVMYLNPGTAYFEFNGVVLEAAISNWGTTIILNQRLQSGLSR